MHSSGWALIWLNTKRYRNTYQELREEFLCNSYIVAFAARSISYDLSSFYAAEEGIVPGLTLAFQAWPAARRRMRLFNHIGRSQEPAFQFDVAPRLADVVVEIGLVLALHLAFALGVVLTLSAFGIA